MSDSLDEHGFVREAPDVASTVHLPTTTDGTFEVFYRQTWPGAVRLAALLTQSASAAEDIAQDSFSRLYGKWTRATNPSAYLRTIIVNQCRQWHRHEKVVKAKLPLLTSRESVDLVVEELSDVVAALPYRQRAVLVMRFYLDLSEVEIASALDCRAGTVKSLSSRALATLRKEIQR